MKRIIGLVVLAFMLSSAGVLAQKTVSKSFSGIKKIRMNTASGSCDIRRSPDASVKVSVDYTYDTDRFEPRMDQEGDRLVIKETYRGNSGNGDSKWTITIPDNMSFTFSTGSGNLDAADISLDLNANTGSGNLTFTNVKGTVDGSTGSGDIELVNFSGDMHANTGSGNIRAEKCLGELGLNCGSGNMRLTDNQVTISANTGSGTIRATSMKLEGSSSFNTGSGSAEVTLASSPKFDVSVNSGSGNAELNFNGNAISGQIVMRYSKRNGRIEAPFEFDKTEEIDNGNNNNDVTIEKSVVKGNGTNRIRVSTGSGTAALRK
jgi:hypothetical protein